MSLPLRIERDADGWPRARWDGEPRRGSELLARFLESDIGGHRAYADQVVAEGERLAAGERASWSCAGNAFGLEMTPEVTVLSRLFPSAAEAEGEEDEIRLPTREFVDVVRRWREHLTEHRPRGRR